MNFPITFKVPGKYIHLLGKWLTANNMFDRVSYDWVIKEISFSDTDDATAFSLKFGISRYETTIERMLKNEESND